MRRRFPSRKPRSALAAPISGPQATIGTCGADLSSSPAVAYGSAVNELSLNELSLNELSLNELSLKELALKELALNELAVSKSGRSTWASGIPVRGRSLLRL